MAMISVKRVALVVEDDPTVQRVMSQRLERLGFDVLLAMHYEAALKHLVAEPSLVCVALELPTESGYELCEYIRGPRGFVVVPILVTSDSNDPTHMANAEQVGANAFLRKPFSPDNFERHVEALVGSRPVREDLRRTTGSMRASVRRLRS